MKKILIVKTGTTVAPLLTAGEDFEDWIISGCGFDHACFETIAVFSGAQIPELSRYSGIIVTGSPAFVSDRETWSEYTASVLKQAVAERKPILGICYGHQLLAHCLGGQIDFHPGGREIGTVAIDLTQEGERDDLLGTLPSTFAAQVSHSQTVTKLPDSAVTLASNEFEPHHAFRVGDCAWGLQFHPEFSARVTKAYIQDRRVQLEGEKLDPVQLLDRVRSTDEAASLLAGFARLALSEN